MSFVFRSRLFLAAVVMVLLPATARGDALDRIKERGTFIYGADTAGGGPFIFPNPEKEGEILGFEVELADLIADELSKQLGKPIKAQFQQGDWDTLPGLADRGTIDVALNGFELTPEHARDYRCSRPYYIYGLQLVSKHDGPISSWDDLTLKSGKKPLKIGVLGSSQAEFYMRNTKGEHAGFNVEVIPYQGNAEAMEQVQDGLLDGVVQDDCIAPYYFIRTTRFPKLKLVGLPVRPGYYVGLFSKNEERLAKAVDDAIGRLIADGRLRALYARWDLAGSIQELSLRHVSEVPPAPHDSAWHLIFVHLPTLLRAAGMTVFLSVVSMPLAIIIGITVAIGRLYGPWYIAKPLGLYVEVLRGTPLMLQLYAIFFLLPKIGLVVHPLLAAIAGLAINYSAYEAEIYRAGLQAIPRGQMEAALSLGMTKFQAIWRIILPQAFRIVIPPVTNDFIALFKDTSVCSVVTVMELTKQYSVLALSTGAVIEMASITAVLYMLMSYPLSLFAAWNERRLQGHAVGHHH